MDREDGPARQIRSALRSAIAALRAFPADWEKVERRLAVAERLTHKLPANEAGSAPGKRVVILSDMIAAAQGRAAARNQGTCLMWAKDAIDALAPLVEAERSAAAGETCTRCAQNGATYVRLAEGASEPVSATLLCGPCMKIDIETMPATAALARTYKLHAATLQEIERGTRGSA